MSKFTEVKPKEINENTFSLISKDWFLLTAGNRDSFNTMTAAWGGLGVLWHRNVCTVYVRPQRYTFEFMEKEDVFTVSFFNTAFRDVLKYCGSHSGRDIDKVAETGITPVFSEQGGIYFNEAKLVIECKKIYCQDMDPGAFLDSSIMDNYPAKDYHRIYIGEIIGCYRAE